MMKLCAIPDLKISLQAISFIESQKSLSFYQYMQGFDSASNRVCTDFFDPKFKTFSRLFSKTIIYFSKLKVIQ